MERWTEMAQAIWQRQVNAKQHLGKFCKSKSTLFLLPGFHFLKHSGGCSAMHRPQFGLELHLRCTCRWKLKNHNLISVLKAADKNNYFACVLNAVTGPITQFPWQKHSWDFLVLILHCTVWKEKLSQLQSYLGVVLVQGRMGLDLVWQAANICCYGIFCQPSWRQRMEECCSPWISGGLFSISAFVGGVVSWKEQPERLTLHWSCWQFLLEIRLPWSGTTSLTFSKGVSNC